MRDLIDDPHPDYTATMMADLTGKTSVPTEVRKVVYMAAGQHTSKLASEFGQFCNAFGVRMKFRAFDGLVVAESTEHALDGVPVLTSQDRPVSPAEAAVEADAGGKAVQVHAGASEGAGRAPEEIYASQTSDGFCAWAELATADVATIYASAQRVMAEVPSLPLAGTEPWAESDEAYWARMIEYAPSLANDTWQEINEGLSLDEIGKDIRFHRWRLVRVEAE